MLTQKLIDLSVDREMHNLRDGVERVFDVITCAEFLHAEREVNQPG